MINPEGISVSELNLMIAEAIRKEPRINRVEPLPFTENTMYNSCVGPDGKEKRMSMEKSL